MRIILAARERVLAEAWQHAMEGIESVGIHHGSILDVGCEAVVSPANSYGFMDGGIDLLDRYPEPTSWAEASERHQLLFLDRAWQPRTQKDGRDAG